MAELSREQFVEQVVQLIRKRFPLVKVGRAPEPFSLRVNGKTVGLENLYRSVMQKPEALVHVTERWTVELLRVGEGTPDRNAAYADVSDRIMPILLTTDLFDSSHGAMLGQTLVEGIHVAYVIDGDRTLTHIPLAQFKKWGVEIDDLHETALKNLIAKSETLAADAAQDEEGKINLILFPINDGYAASRLLLPNLHERLKGHLGSPFLAAIPNRDILICIRNDASILGSVKAQIAQDYQTMPRQITEKLFLVTADGLAPYSEAA